MKNHVYRPLFVVVGILVIILVARALSVPKDFGVHERGYTYGWYRKSDEQFWKDFKVKYRGAEYCKDCHDKNYESLKKSPHQHIQCENCHSPAVDHPDNPPKLGVDRSREWCLRCHAYLAYPTSGRRFIRGFEDPEKHNPGTECAVCHNPHSPKL
jgi:hypothetical protein